MAALILPTRRVVQPQGPVGVDWSNPITRGLVFLDLQPGIGQPVTYGEADYTIGIGSVENTTGQNGRGLRVISEGQNYLTYGLTGQVAPPYSILLQYVLPTAPTAALRLFGNFSANQYGYNLTPSTTNGRFATAMGGASIVVTGGVHRIGVVRTVVGVVDATNIRYYEDGVLVGGPTAHGGVATPTGALRIGADNFGVVNSVRATVFAAGIYNRALSAHEVAALTARQSSIWQLAKPIERRIWVPVSAGGGGVSQTVAFTLDGISAAVAQVVWHTQSLSASLDGVTFSASQVAGHSQTLAATLDGVSFAAAQTVGGANSQSLAVTLDGVQFAASQTLGHAQSATVALDGVTFAASQTLRHSQSLVAALDDLTFSATQSASSPVKSQSLAVTLDDLQFYATQEGPQPDNLTTAAPGLIPKSWPLTVRYEGKRRRKHEQDEEKRIQEIAEEAVLQAAEEASKRAMKASIESSMKAAQLELAAATMERLLKLAVKVHEEKMEEEELEMVLALL